MRVVKSSDAETQSHRHSLSIVEFRVRWPARILDVRVVEICDERPTIWATADRERRILPSIVTEGCFRLSLILWFSRIFWIPINWDTEMWFQMNVELRDVVVINSVWEQEIDEWWKRNGEADLTRRWGGQCTKYWMEFTRSVFTAGCRFWSILSRTCQLEIICLSNARDENCSK